MREQKFRVWEPINKEVVYLDFALYEHNSYSKENYFVLPMARQCTAKDYIYMNLDAIDIMQYIGLEDINKKEIYEGDIVKTKYGIERIEYFDKEARFRITNYNGGSDKISDYIYDGGLEVIGNVYENKDLLGNREGE